jgi:hypothetical protein
VYGFHIQNQDDNQLKELLKSNIDKEMKLVVYSAKTQECRDLSITPTNTWGGQGLLGVSIRFCSFEGASENIWHILDVYPNSPAAAAGLHSFDDFIIGTDSSANEDDFGTIVEANDHKELKIYVYNVQSDKVREVSITPDSGWGGEGLLGCDIGYGYLHRIPTKSKSEDPEKVSEKFPEIHDDSNVELGSSKFTGVPLMVPSDTLKSEHQDSSLQEPLQITEVPVTEIGTSLLPPDSTVGSTLPMTSPPAPVDSNVMSSATLTPSLLAQDLSQPGSLGTGLIFPAPVKVELPPPGLTMIPTDTAVSSHREEQTVPAVTQAPFSGILPPGSATILPTHPISSS